MSTLYLLDLFANDPTPGTIKEIVVPIATVPTLVTGRYVVRIPDDIVVPETITSSTDLLTAKYVGFLTNGLFTNIVYDDMNDATGIDLVSSNGIATGVRGVNAIYPDGSLFTPRMQMNMVALAAAAPSQAMIRYELFKYTATDDLSARYLRGYEEVIPDVDVLCQLSFNNGATWLTAYDNTPLNIPVPDQGTQLIVRFTRTTASTVNPKLYLGSWAVLY
jgi:hypothetical protein